MTYFKNPKLIVSFSPFYLTMLAQQDVLLANQKTVNLLKHLERVKHSLPDTVTLGPIPEKILHDLDDKIRELCQMLGEVSPGVRFTFSGSTVKGTFVWGISDIDILCLCEGWKRRMPRLIVNELYKYISEFFEVENLTNHLLIKIIPGVVVDLVPGLHNSRKNTLLLPDVFGTSWIEIHPELFVSELQRLNEERHGIIRPTIRLLKFYYKSTLSESSILGHHLEVLVYNIAKKYENVVSVSDLFKKVLKEAPLISEEPLNDPSSQFTQIDYNFGSKADPRRLLFIKNLIRAKDIMTN